jgi:arsenite-transporting ATPase
LQEIEESFTPLPIFKVQHQGQEVFGLDLLKKIALATYGERDPKAIFHSEPPVRLEENERYYILHLHLPFLAQHQFSLQKFGEELVINLGTRRKSIILPRFANFLSIEDHQYENDHLHIRFLKK